MKSKYLIIIPYVFVVIIFLSRIIYLFSEVEFLKSVLTSGKSMVISAYCNLSGMTVENAIQKNYNEILFFITIIIVSSVLTFCLIKKYGDEKL